MRGKAKVYAPEAVEYMQKLYDKEFLENLFSQNEEKSNDQLSDLLIKLDEEQGDFFRENMDKIMSQTSDDDGRNIFKEINGVLREALMYGKNLQGYFSDKAELKENLKLVHENIRMLSALEQIDQSETPAELEKSYGLARGELEGCI